MKILRIPQEDDQKNTEKAVKLIYEVIKNNKEIDDCLWACALSGCLANIYISSEFTYEEYVDHQKKLLNVIRNNGTIFK